MHLPAPVESKKLAEVLQPFRAADGMPLALRYQPQGVDSIIQLGDEWKVGPSDALKLALEQALGARDVAVEY
jgi:DNA polymerase-3 subunit alpha